MTIGSYGGLLDGVRILDLTHFIAGPYGTQYLADLGADVVKVEPPDGGDLGRGAGTTFVAGESIHFWAVNKNKRSVILDLKQDEGRELFYRLAEEADVVFDNFRPGVVERLGIDYDSLRKRNPRIICTSISAYGQDGPYHEQPGYDLTIQALSGVMSLTGELGGPPLRCGVPIGDLVGGMAGAMATLAALINRQKTGSGQRIDISLLDNQVSLLMYWAAMHLATGEIPGPVGASHPTIVPYGSFETKDSHIVIAVFGDRFFRQLCDTIGLSGLAEDDRFKTNPGRVRHRSEIVPQVEEVFKTRTTEEWLETLRAVGIPAAPVNDVAAALADPQVGYRQMMVSVDHPTAGEIRLLGNPIKSSVQRDDVLHPPLFGEHTREILGELGLSEEELNRLETAGITAPRDERV